MAEGNVSIQSQNGKIVFVDNGVPVTEVQASEPIRDGVHIAHNVRSLPIRHKIYMAAMVLITLVMYGFTIYRLTQLSTKNPEFVLCFVLLFNYAFWLIYSFDGILRERPCEMLLLAIVNLLIVIYLVINYTNGIRTHVKLVRMVIAVVVSVPLISYALREAWQYHTRGQLIFRAARSTSSETQKLVTRLFWFQDLLKFDLQLQGSLLILVFGWKYEVTYIDWIILCIGVPYTFIWFFLGYFGFARENKPGAIAFFTLSVLGYAHIAYKLWDFYRYEDVHQGLAVATLAITILSFIMRTQVIILAGVVRYRFGQGMQELLNNPFTSITAEKEEDKF